MGDHARQMGPASEKGVSDPRSEACLSTFCQLLLIQSVPKHLRLLDPPAIPGCWDFHLLNHTCL